MSATLDIKEARKIAFKMHERDTDKSGNPYSDHLESVRLGVRILGGSIDEEIAALFHDAVEDRHTTIKGLVDIGLTPESLKIVEALTKRSGEEQGVYLQRIIKAGHGACRVKVADILNNTRHDRLAKLPAHTRDRLLKKYRPALAALMLELGLIASQEDHDALVSKPLPTIATKPKGSAAGFNTGYLPLPTYKSTEPSKQNVSAITRGDWLIGDPAPVYRKKVISRQESGKTVTVAQLTLCDGEMYELYYGGPQVEFYSRYRWETNTHIKVDGCLEVEHYDYFSDFLKSNV